MSVPSVRFRATYPWAFPPRAAVADRERAKADAAAFSESFRWVRRERVPQFCPPWTMAYEMGWRVTSPIDITFTPLEQVELESGEDPEAAAAAAGATELWSRERSALAVGSTSWLHLYQYRSGRGHWENMFLPNGQGTVEWRLGWTVRIPRGYFLLVMPSDPRSPLEVPVGVLSSTATDKMSASGTAAVAVKPTEVIKVERGQEVARLILLHVDSLRANATYPEELDDGTDGKT